MENRGKTAPEKVLSVQTLSKEPVPQFPHLHELATKQQGAALSCWEAQAAASLFQRGPELC